MYNNLYSDYRYISIEQFGQQGNKGEQGDKGERGEQGEKGDKGEMARKEPKSGWRARLRFYTNVLVDDGTEDPYVAVWSQGISKQSAFNTIREYALETGSISNLG